MLVLVPTETEAAPLRKLSLTLKIIGVGTVEAALSTLKILKTQRPGLAFLCGLAGAYPASGLTFGDVVLATEEIFGDLGLCFPKVTFKPSIEYRISLRNPWLEKVQALLFKTGLEVAYGPMVTVCCTSREPKRAQLLSRRYAALAENMEGFAVARAAREVGVALVEIRAISNLLGGPEVVWDREKAFKALQETLACLNRTFK